MDPSFPRNPDEFDDDERISFSRLEQKFIAVHEDGTEFEFDAELREWIPTGDDDEPLDAEDYGGEEAAAAAAAATTTGSNGASLKRKLADVGDDSEVGERTALREAAAHFPRPPLLTRPGSGAPKRPRRPGRGRGRRAGRHPSPRRTAQCT